MTGSALAQAESVGSVTANLGFFLLFVIVTLLIVLRVSRTNATRADYYTGGHAFTGPQNGTAIAGDFLSAASFLGIAGAIALYGYDGFLYSIGFLVGWLMALLLVAELLRNTGRFTMGDVLAFRMRQRPVRAAAATSTLVVSFFYLVAQMAGAGGLISLLLQIPKDDAFSQAMVIVVVGGLMIVYVLFGGMKGTTWVQIIKAGLLLVGSAVMTTWVLGRYGFDLSTVLERATENSEHGEAVLAPGLQYTNKIDFISLGLALVLGTVGLPHILMRFYTVPSAKEARRSVVWAIWLIGTFYLFTLVLGYGAMALLPAGTITRANQNDAAPLLAYALGGEIMLGLIAAVAFATILAVVAGLTITASASFAHDVYANVIRRGNASPDAEVRVARTTALVIGLVAIGGGIIANGQNVAFLVALAFAVAASANLPTILFSLFWKRFNTTGALCSIYGGVLICVGLIVVSPAVSGSPTSMIPSADFAIFPLSNPGLVSIPASFLLGIVGTLLGGTERFAAARYAEMEVRSLTGAGAVRATTAPKDEPKREPVTATSVGAIPTYRGDDGSRAGRASHRRSQARPQAAARQAGELFGGSGATGAYRPGAPRDPARHRWSPPDAGAGEPPPDANEMTLPHGSLFGDEPRR
ncbi:cation/acetate symporter [Pseudonocardia autotrophica]|uniref:Cation/acetate symporter ActP n=2 Tax=Pseudonocardia TaxID=1847 RepID=A0A1Y2MVT5_PSEAH|nr:Cation/acetate symporter ActP [Pseudonocardia autotrophica]TDN74950.1 cation/acetate symporter [Pseudonocardia autotrophica]BBF98889.1 cation acetate symporter [Pseudonocardia autotrophica]GEC27831.1 cation acetate symporter [Pseudonocardia saturnea]